MLADSHQIDIDDLVIVWLVALASTASHEQRLLRQQRAALAQRIEDGGLDPGQAGCHLDGRNFVGAEAEDFL
jgi:hypothetical protein